MGESFGVSRDRADAVVRLARPGRRPVDCGDAGPPPHAAADERGVLEPGPRLAWRSVLFHLPPAPAAPLLQRGFGPWPLPRDGGVGRRRAALVGGWEGRGRGAGEPNVSFRGAPVPGPQGAHRGGGASRRGTRCVSYCPTWMR